MPLPLPQPAQPAPQLPSTPAEIETLIGQVTAAAVGELAHAVQEWHRAGAGCARPGANAVADRVAQLVLLKQATAGEIADFESTAHTQALRLLRQCCGADVSDKLLASLIDDLLRLADRVARTQWH
jgi:hypothetical protein